MKSFGIIAEFNPLHNGHNYIINTAKELGATHIAVALSGNFVQRGDLAIISKFKRAEMAIKAGADLVLEMPLGYSLSSANRFAYCGVNILKNFSDNIIFGSETADKELLFRAVNILNSDEFKLNLSKHLKSGNTFAKARYLSVKSIDKEAAELLNSPNNTLGIEYILEAQKIENELNFYPVERIGADHCGKTISNKFCSASYIRENINKAKKFMPRFAYDILQNEIKAGKIADIKNIENSILSHLKSMNHEDFENLPDISEGLHNRIKKIADSAITLDELYDNIKTKRYTHARIRRIILAAYLGINESYYDVPLPYIRVLAFNKKGEELIKIARKNGVNVISSLKNAETISDDAKKIAKIEQKAGKLYGLAYNKKCDFNEYKYKVYKEN